MILRRLAGENGPFSGGPSLTTVTKPTGVQQGKKEHQRGEEPTAALEWTIGGEIRPLS